MLLAASAIRAARSVQQSQAEASALAQRQQEGWAAHHQVQADAHAQGLEALQAQADAADARLAQLAALSEQLGNAEAMQLSRPQRPHCQDYRSLAEYVRAVDAFSADAQSAILTAFAGQPSDDGGDAALALSRDLPFLHQAMPSVRQLQKIAHLGPVPAELQALADELDALTDTGGAERAELLTTELRRGVQLHAERALQEEVQRAQALVIEQSLQDLGYQVEEIESTLFVEGGVAHFRKSHWGDYMVRMRVTEGGDSVNFNVVRAVDAQEVAEVSVQDHLAEDRWCAEFPAFLKALAARGVDLEVTRRLQAGELPVQRVSRDRLPRFADTQAMESSSALQPRARPLP